MTCFSMDAGTLPSRSSAEGLTVEEETRGYLQKAREYIERLGECCSSQDLPIYLRRAFLMSHLQLL